MELPVGIEEFYYVRRIDNWYIDIEKDIIHGHVKLWYVDYDVPVRGRILAWVDRHIMVRIEGKLYGLVPGNVDPKKIVYRDTYYEYLRKKHLKPHIVV